MRVCFVLCLSSCVWPLVGLRARGVVSAEEFFCWRCVRARDDASHDGLMRVPARYPPGGPRGSPGLAVNGLEGFAQSGPLN